MNNKGFAITTILYGTLILFCLLIVSMLGILSTWRNNLDLLIDNAKGARNIVKIDKISGDAPIPTVSKVGLYCRTADTTKCRYCIPGDTCNLG